MSSFTLAKQIAALKYLQKELRTDLTVNELIAVLAALKADCEDGSPICAIDTHGGKIMSKEIVHNVFNRFSGNDYRGREVYPVQLFNRRKKPACGKRLYLFANRNGVRIYKKLKTILD